VPLSFEVTLEGFSGPLDLLCALVESRAIAASRVRVSDVVRLYGAYLARGDVMTIREMAEFFALAARLLLGKLQALMPGIFREEEGGAPEEDPTGTVGGTEEDVEEALARYRPFRAAARMMEERFHRRAAYVGRRAEEGEKIFDLGDVYALACLWWPLIRQKRRPSVGICEEDFWDEEGVPSMVPEESQVESCMDRLRSLMTPHVPVELDGLLEERRSRSALVLVLLALLELSRRNEVKLVQSDCFGSLRVTRCANPAVEGSVP